MGDIERKQGKESGQPPYRKSWKTPRRQKTASGEWVRNSVDGEEERGSEREREKER